MAVEVYPLLARGVFATLGYFVIDPRLNLSAEHGAPITLAGASRLSDGDRIPVGGIAGALEVLHVPGHTDDSCAFWCEQGGFALVGDAVYEGGPGLTVFPTGDGPRLRESIRKSILALPPDTMLLSGHSRPMTVAMLAASMR